MEAAVWAAARWADTYLLPDHAVPEPLAHAFGAGPIPNGGPGSECNGGGGGPAVLDVLVKVAGMCLASFPGEKALHNVSICGAVAVTCVSWICFLSALNAGSGRHRATLHIKTYNVSWTLDWRTV